jgi:serine/threonine protein kinase/Tol biopolymer transport system component
VQLTPGEKLGPYEVLEPVGKGGMGEVYRGVDTRLGRPVAIKISAREFSDRFEREARAISAPNHPNICTLYDVGANYLVMEFVDGEMLSTLIDRGPMPLDKALGHAMQIVDALSAAHAKGVVHRDLKPGNIMVTRNGVKVLDFGLAKLSAERLASMSSASLVETAAAPITREGAILGTLSYMAPEQVEGKEADERSDIFAFGAVFYEMITGHPPFTGDTSAAVLAAILRDQPPPMKQWHPGVPRALDRLVRKCLEKKPDDRWQSARDLKPALELIDLDAAPVSTGSSGAPVPVQAPAPSPLPTPRVRIGVWPAVAAALVIALAATVWVLWPAAAPPPPEATRFEITQPGSTSFVSISPDGRTLAFVATGADGRVMLWVRNLATLESRPVQGTEGAIGTPFWSPDSRNIVFTSAGKLRRIEATGGPNQVLCDSPTLLRGGFWTADNRIVFSDAAQNLMQVAAAGGTPTPVTEGAGPGESHAYPALLPDGRHFVYTRGGQNGGVFLGTLGLAPAEQSQTRLLADTSPVAFAPSADPSLGYLLFVRRANAGAQITDTGTLMAQPFDTSRLATAGEPVPIAEDISPIAWAVSANGVLVYRPGLTVLPTASNALNTGTRGILTWFDRTGKVLSTAGDVTSYSVGISLSPDGTRVASAHAEQGNTDIWIFEFARGVSTRFTFDPAVDYSPAWSPDGSRIVFASNRGGKWAFYEKASNGAGAEEPFFNPEVADRPTPFAVSRDGRFLTYSASRGGINFDSFVVPMAGTSAERKGTSIVGAQFNERGTRFSPDGRWFSYTSNESGRDEAYVRPFDPETGRAGEGQFMISKDGGASPKWRGDGKEMFYLAPGGTIMSVEITTTPSFSAATPKPLFKGPAGVIYWELAADGQRFLMPVPQQAGSSQPYRVVLNWPSTLQK